MPDPSWDAAKRRLEKAGYPEEVINARGALDLWMIAANGPVHKYGTAESIQKMDELGLQFDKAQAIMHGNPDVPQDLATQLARLDGGKIGEQLGKLEEGGTAAKTVYQRYVGRSTPEPQPSNNPTLQELGYSPEQIEQFESNPGMAASVREWGIRADSPAGGEVGQRAEQDHAKATTSPAPAPAAPAGPPAAPPAGPGIIAEQQAYYRDRARANNEAQIAQAQRYGRQVEGLGDAWAQGLLDSSGYQGVGDARDEYMKTYNQGGLTDVTRANLEASRREEDQWVRAQREAHLRDLAERGTTGGGAEIAGLIGDRAAAADRMSARDLETHAFAQQQAMDALGSANRASETLYGYDKDRITGLSDYYGEGVAEENNVLKGIADNDQKVLNEFTTNYLTRSGRLEDIGASDVLPAAQTGGQVIRDEGGEQRDNIANLVDSDNAKNTQTGGDLGGLTGGVLPTPSPQQPLLGLGSGAAAGAAAEGSAQTAFDVGSRLLTSIKKPEAATALGGG